MMRAREQASNRQARKEYEANSEEKKKKKKKAFNEGDFVGLNMFGDLEAILASNTGDNKDIG